MSLVAQISSLAQRIANEIKAVRAEKVSGAGLTIWRGTQAQYDALAVKNDANTLYLIRST